MWCRRTPTWRAARMWGRSCSPCERIARSAHERNHEWRECGREHAEDDCVGARSPDHVGEVSAVVQMHLANLCADNSHVSRGVPAYGIKWTLKWNSQPCSGRKSAAVSRYSAALR